MSLLYSFPSMPKCSGFNNSTAEADSQSQREEPVSETYLRLTGSCEINAKTVLIW